MYLDIVGKGAGGAGATRDILLLRKFVGRTSGAAYPDSTLEKRAEKGASTRGSIGSWNLTREQNERLRVSQMRLERRGGFGLALSPGGRGAPDPTCGKGAPHPPWGGEGRGWLAATIVYGSALASSSRPTASRATRQFCGPASSPGFLVLQIPPVG
jgi:hypothetical protein